MSQQLQGYEAEEAYQGATQACGSSGEEEVYWQFTSRRKGHGLSEEVVRMVHDFYVAHPSIKRSPIAGDVLKIKQADGSYVLTAKLLSEISLTDVFLDFQKEYPDVRIKERSFRYLRPVELRRMKTRHLEMCGCRQAARPPSLGRACPPGSHTT